MPLFSNTSGVNIHGGSFYDVSGDMNVQNNQQLVIQDSQADYHDPWAALGASLSSIQGPSTLQQDVGLYNADGGRSLPEVIRNNQQTGTGQSLPYDASFRHQTRSQKHSSPTDDSFYDQPHIHPDAYNTTAPLPHLRNVNTPGGMHLETNQQVMIRDGQADCHDPWAALGASLSSIQGPSTLPQDVGLYNVDGGRSLPGVTRNTRQTRTGRSLPYDTSFRHQTHSHRRPSPADDSSYDQLNNPLDNYDTTAHLWSGVEFGPDNGSMSSYPPWTGNTHNPERGTSINGGTFIGGNVNNVVQGGDTGLQILHREVSESLQAMHDSRDSYAQPKCHPDTRTEMLEKLYNWCITSEGFDGSDGTVDSHSDMETPFFEDVTERQPVLWLHGPAGAGKSALMRTLAERLATSGHLGGSFFFKRGHPTRGNAQKLFATLAYQLAFNIPQLKARISSIMANIPYVAVKSMDVQLQKLVTEPCMQLNTSPLITVLIDGLDECNEPGVQQEVLRCIGHSIRAQDSCPIQFLIASRPESHLREVFQGSLFHEIHNSFNVDQSFEDVRMYLKDEFARIHREHHQTMAGVSRPWPSPDVIKYLVDESSGYFIYAATVIKFVDDRNFRPTEQLKALLDASHLESPFGALDQLYMQILSAVPARHRLFPILRALEFFEFQLYTAGIEQVLELKPGDVQLTLRGLHSVLYIPEPEDDNDYDERISVHHASFRDFLKDQSRSGEFYVDDLQHRVELGKSVLKTFSYTYDDPAINVAGPVALSEGMNKAFDKIPPLPEMIPLIRCLNPDFFFSWFSDISPSQILSLLEAIGNPPEDLVQLWEDYQFMHSLQHDIRVGLRSPPMDNNDSSLSTEAFQVLSQCALLPLILRAHILVGHWCQDHFLHDIHLLLDISYADLRAALCPLRHIRGYANADGMRRLLRYVAEHLSPEIAVRQLSLELAQQWMRLMKKGKQHLEIWYLWGCFIRASPHSLELLQDIRQATFDPNDFSEATYYRENYHDTLQWLKSFPDPLQDVIQVWEQHIKAARRSYKPDLESHWREWQASLKKWFPHLRVGQNS